MVSGNILYMLTCIVIFNVVVTYSLIIRIHYVIL